MKLEHHLGRLVERHGKAHAAAVGSASQIPNFTGTWVNELNSTVVLLQSRLMEMSPPEISPSALVPVDELTGIYYSPASANFQQAWGRLYGFVSGNLISFAVTWIGQQSGTWSTIQSSCAWEGHATGFDYSGKPNAFTTNWQLTYFDETNFVFVTGNDQFTLQP